MRATVYSVRSKKSAPCGSAFLCFSVFRKKERVHSLDFYLEIIYNNIEHKRGGYNENEESKNDCIDCTRQ